MITRAYVITLHIATKLLMRAIHSEYLHLSLSSIDFKTVDSWWLKFCPLTHQDFIITQAYVIKLYINTNLLVRAIYSLLLHLL